LQENTKLDLIENNINDFVQFPKVQRAKILERIVMKQRRKGLKMGRVNSHVWYKTCTINMDSMRQNPLYPLWPDERIEVKMSNELESITTVSFAFQRVFGFLYPPATGDYKFKIFSGTMSEFWLSTDYDHRKASLLVKNNRDPLLSVLLRSGLFMITSKPIYLHKGEAYYFEMLHSVNKGWSETVRVRWMLPDHKEYTGIPKSCLSTFLNKEDYFQNDAKKLLTNSASIRLRESVLKQPIAYKWKDKKFSGPFEVYSSYTKENFHTIEFADRWKIMSVFDTCDYAPSFTRRRNYTGVEGVRSSKQFTDVFPGDDTWDKEWEDRESSLDTSGNAVIRENDVIEIVNMFMMAVEKKFPG